MLYLAKYLFAERLAKAKPSRIKNALSSGVSRIKKKLVGFARRIRRNKEA